MQPVLCSPCPPVNEAGVVEAGGGAASAVAVQRERDREERRQRELALFRIGEEREEEPGREYSNLPSFTSVLAPETEFALKKREGGEGGEAGGGTAGQGGRRTAWPGEGSSPSWWSP